MQGRAGKVLEVRLKEAERLGRLEGLVQGLEAVVGPAPLDHVIDAPVVAGFVGEPGLPVFRGEETENPVPVVGNPALPEFRLQVFGHPQDVFLEDLGIGEDVLVDTLKDIPHRTFPGRVGDGEGLVDVSRPEGLGP